jgi:hypothetical protein
VKLNKRFWQQMERKIRENDRRQERQRVGEFDSLESAPPLLVVLRHDLGKLPAGIAIQFPHEVAIHQRYSVPVADFKLRPDLEVQEEDLQFTDFPPSVIPLGLQEAILETGLEAA